MPRQTGRCSVTMYPTYVPQMLFGKTIREEWQHIRNREQTEKIRELTRGAENMLILTQHDPDPDALASGMALRTLLGRNRRYHPARFSGRGDAK